MAALGWAESTGGLDDGEDAASSKVAGEGAGRAPRKRRLLTFSTAEAVGVLARSLQPLKVVFLRQEGGLRRLDGRDVSKVVLASDLEGLLSPGQRSKVVEELDGWRGREWEEEEEGWGVGGEHAAPSPWLSDGDAESVREAAVLLRPDLPPGAAGLEPGTTVSMTSPQHLASELFLSQGAGTLVTRGERVQKLRSLPWWEDEDGPAGTAAESGPAGGGGDSGHRGQGSDDGEEDDDDDDEDSPRVRLQTLLEQAFGASLDPGYWASIRPKLRAIYVLESWRGAAIVTEEGGFPYLCKFAVDPTAQGEQLGQAVWKALVTGEPRFCWRSRSSNPVNGWYFGQADGSYLAHVAKDGAVGPAPAAAAASGSGGGGGPQGAAVGTGGSGSGGSGGNNGSDASEGAGRRNAGP